MKYERHRPAMQRYEAGGWLVDDTAPPKGEFLRIQSDDFDTGAVTPDARERSRLLRLLGLLNYRILAGNKIYIAVGGVVYKTTWGGYWRSVFTGVEHYLLKCEEVSGGIWTEGSNAVRMIDLPIANTRDGWTAKGLSLKFLLNRD